MAHPSTKGSRAIRALKQRISAWETGGSKSPGGHLMHKPGSLKKSAGGTGAKSGPTFSRKRRKRQDSRRKRRD